MTLVSTATIKIHFTHVPSSGTETTMIFLWFSASPLCFLRCNQVDFQTLLSLKDQSFLFMLQVQCIPYRYSAYQTTLFELHPYFYRIEFSDSCFLIYFVIDFFSKMDKPSPLKQPQNTVQVPFIDLTRNRTTGQLRITCFIYTVNIVYL